jgi:hypothetical protein
MLSTTSIDGADERRILTAMITDRAVLAQLSARWPTGGLFSGRWANLIARWCIYHAGRFGGTAPGREIEGIYRAWAAKTQMSEEKELVGRFLGQLNGEYEQAGEQNSQYVIDLAGRYFNRVRLEQLLHETQCDIEDGKVDEAQTRVEGWRRVEVGVGAGIDVFSDQAALQRAFEEPAESLIEYPGELGKFFGPYFERDGFIAFLGPEKRGKSWWLMDLAYRAAVQRRRTAYFMVGDMSEGQTIRRLAMRATGHPRHARTVQRPVKLWMEGADVRIEHEDRVYEEGLTWQRAWRVYEKIRTNKIRSESPYLKLSVHPNSSINVAGIRAVLDDWGRGDWVPDVVVVDYADILAPPPGRYEGRDQINENWKAMRALSQSMHCLLITATQANADGARAETVRRWNWSDDKRKMAHVTGVVGLSQGTDEKEKGLMRLNWVLLREGSYSELRCCHVAMCLDVGHPSVLSC